MSGAVVSGEYWNNQPVGPPHGQAAPVTRLLGATLLVVTAGLAAGGSFGAFTVYRFDSGTSSTTRTTTGWAYTFDQDPPDVEPGAPLLGIPLTVGAVLALVAALLLVLGGRRAGEAVQGRVLGTAAGGLICGTVASIWLDLVSSISYYAALRDSDGADVTYTQTVDPGIGGWLVLAAGVLALVAVGLLLLPGRSAPGGLVPPYPGATQGAPFAPAYPPEPATAPNWPQP